MRFRSQHQQCQCQALLGQMRFRWISTILVPDEVRIPTLPQTHRGKMPLRSGASEGMMYGR